MLLQQLTTLVRVAEAGSFTRAAAELSLSQPSITKQIAALEQELGATLIDRSGRTLHLTPAGEVALDVARRVIADVNRLREAIDALMSPDRGQVSIACVTSIGLFTLPPLLAEFTHGHPHVRVKVMTGNIQECIDLLLAGQADLGLITTPIVHHRLEAVPLFKDRVLLVAAPKLADGFPRPLSIARLGELGLLAYKAPSRFRSYVDEVLGQHGIRLNVAMEFNSHEAVKTMVRLGLGAAMLPESAVREDIAEGALVEIPVAGLPEMSRTTCLILRRDAQRSRAAESFIELVRAAHAA